MHSSAPKSVFMVRPKHFGFSTEAASSNVFQVDDKSGPVAKDAVAEFDNMREKLQEFGVSVTVFEDTDDPVKEDAVFPNNWISTQPDGTTVIYPMCVSTRRPEIRDDIISTILQKGNGKVIDLRHFVNAEKYLEGTGGIVFDHTRKLAYACRSVRMHDEVLKNLCSQIGYTAVIFTARDESGVAIYHTNVIMAIGSGWNIMCDDFVEDGLEKEQLLKCLKSGGQKCFKLTPESIRSFSGNCFEVQSALEKNVLIISTAGWAGMPLPAKEFLGENLAICATPIPTIERIGGGSARCMVAGIYFEGK